jgi:DNA-binding transcriptional LysR family regulator
MIAVSRDDLVQMRQVDELSNAEIGARLGLPATTVRSLLERHGIKLTPGALERLRTKGQMAGRAASRRKPNAQQRAWGTGRFASTLEGAPAPVVPSGPKPVVTGTDMMEMIQRALAAGYPVTVAPTYHADGSKRLTFGQEVG